MKIEAKLRDGLAPWLTVDAVESDVEIVMCASRIAVFTLKHARALVKAIEGACDELEARAEEIAQ